MSKKVIAVIIIIFIFIISIFIGLNLFKVFNKKNNEDIRFEDLYNKDISQDIIEIEDEMVKANSKEEKITPNTKLVLRKYYEECGHTINEYVELPVEFINLTKEELEEEYKDWNIYLFSENQVILIKSVNDYCEQHYILRNRNDYVAIYKVNKNGKEEFIEQTSIAIRYLTETDLSHLKSGIKIYGLENLNKTLEDFE